VDRLDFLTLLARTSPRNVVFTSAYLTPLPLDRHSTILEVGCGLGHRSAWVARSRCCPVYAVDQNARCLDLSKQKAEEGGADHLVKLVQVDHYQDLPFSPKTFDLIMMEEYNVQMGLVACVEKWRHLIKPGGHMALSFPFLTQKASSPEMKVSTPEIDAYYLKKIPDIGILPLSAYHEQIGSLSGVKLVHQVQLGAMVWDEYYLDMSRYLKFLVKKGDVKESDALYQEIRGEIDFFKKHLRNRVSVQAFLLNVNGL
jgi:ubiquinone/menaquinone biosynthesis C-methylase UbiE